MRVRLLAPLHGEPRQQNLTSFLVNDTVVIDAGFVGFHSTPREQAQIQHLLLSNTRACNIASLAIFVENAFEPLPDCVTIHASTHSLTSLQEDVFNDRVWPDFIGLSTPEAPFLKTEEIHPGDPILLEGLRITAAEVDAVVPSLAYLVENSGSTAVFVPDTAPTQQIWELANSVPSLDALFVHLPHCDDQLQEARAAKTLTPALLAEELTKLKEPPKCTYAVLSKWLAADRIVQELAGLAVEPIVANKDYFF